MRRRTGNRKPDKSDLCDSIPIAPALDPSLLGCASARIGLIHQQVPRRNRCADSVAAARRLAARVIGGAIGAALFFGASAAAAAEGLFDFDAGAFYDSNLSRAQRASDQRADAAATLAASAANFYALTGNDGLTLSIDGRGEAYHRFHGLNFLGTGASADYRHKFGLGYAAPWLRIAASASYDGYQQNLRSGARWDARAELGERFSERFDAAIGGMLDRRYAQHDEPVVPGISGKVFDLRGHSAYLRAGYAATEALFLGTRLEVRRGDVVSSTRRNLEIFEASSAVAHDPAFGEDFFAYRLRGTTGTATVSASWAIDQRSSLNLAYAAERTRAYDELNYHSDRVDFSYAYRY